ncbi:response regulator transcription factor [Edaphobacter modestus]|uniref:Two-component system KDP operon response regulator KdpE n=1 Tax=Edaphobacter modestus TaxID=388466 RepID=A0A4Q7YYN9_9BACT|nr:response regulator transcription factor [Edaphobacter modestus]RZU42313.1 two-component system KDP operon response regulator KdpE [Edaphobacter modestus]
MSSTILVVDDDPQITRMLRTSLQASGYRVRTSHDGVAALEQIQAEMPDLVITDISMPRMNGIELTKEVRRTSLVPIIVLSVRDTDDSKVSALDEGADDYITKPFRTPELLARVRAHLRRKSAVASQDTPPRIVQVGDFEIDSDSRLVKVKGESIHLSPKEFELLLLFANNPLRVLTHKTLLKSIWGSVGASQPEYLRVLIAQLRKKIEPISNAPYVQSEPWVGYRFHPTGNDELTTF